MLQIQDRSPQSRSGASLNQSQTHSDATGDTVVSYIPYGLFLCLITSLVALQRCQLSFVLVNITLVMHSWNSWFAVQRCSGPVAPTPL